MTSRDSVEQWSRIQCDYEYEKGTVSQDYTTTPRGRTIMPRTNSCECTNELLRKQETCGALVRTRTKLASARIIVPVTTASIPSGPLSGQWSLQEDQLTKITPLLRKKSQITGRQVQGIKRGNIRC